jgi:hypothetical protein
MLGTASGTLAWFAEWQSGLRYESPDQATTEAMIRRKVIAALHAAGAVTDQQVRLPEACRLVSLEKFAAVLRLLN